jgi:tRNA (guanine-N7-)-methyltransferase
MGKRKGGKQREKLDDDPITLDGDMPQKRFYRQRAHCNPLSHNTSFDQ